MRHRGFSKYAATVLMALAVILFGTQCRFEPEEGGAGRSAYGKNIAEKSMFSAKKSVFSDERILVLFTPGASRDLKVYSPEDFPELRIARLDDMTKFSRETIVKRRGPGIGAL